MTIDENSTNISRSDGEKMIWCKHCKKDLTEKVEFQRGIYHVCRGIYFCDHCWEYLLDNERKYYRHMEKLKLINGEVE